MKDICEEWMIDHGVAKADIDALRANLLEDAPAA